jgi:hypothetical protein
MIKTSTSGALVELQILVEPGPRKAGPPPPTPYPSGLTQVTFPALSIPTHRPMPLRYPLSQSHREAIPSRFVAFRVLLFVPSLRSRGGYCGFVGGLRENGRGNKHG